MSEKNSMLVGVRGEMSDRMKEIFLVVSPPPSPNPNPYLSRRLSTARSF